MNQLEKVEAGLIVVSQRVSTVLRSNQILVLEDGVISQRGSHAELLQDKDGFYARLYQRQLLESELREDREEA